MTGMQLRGAAIESVYSLAYVGYWAAAAFVYWYGGRQVVAGTISIGDLIALVWLLGMVDVPANRFVAVHANWQTVLASADRLEPYLNRRAVERGRRRLRPGRHQIEFRDVSVTYPTNRRPALHRVSFRIDAGARTAVVGPSGAGKSTLVNLLLRLRDPDEGAVLFDGVAADDIAPASLRQRIAIVQQEPFLFAGTVRENIELGRPGCGDSDIERAARVANAHNFIERLPAGYNTEVGERGAQLSVGQKQRIAIARAVLRDPDVLILDEATSSLDAASEHAVTDAIECLAQGRTTIMVAHRMSTIQHADRIVVLDSGEVVAQGQHAELERTCELYAQLVRLQKIVSPAVA
jgi:ABC-type multidrug transport system fused ATPase/permease subunit